MLIITSFAVFHMQGAGIFLLNTAAGLQLQLLVKYLYARVTKIPILKSRQLESEKFSY